MDNALGSDLLVELIDALGVDATRAVLGDMPLRTAPEMNLHGISFDDAVFVFLVPGDEAEVLFKELDRILDVECRQDRNRMGEHRYHLLRYHNQNVTTNMWQE